MIITAKTFRQLTIIVRELGYNKTPGTLKKQKGMWIYKSSPASGGANNTGI